MGLKPCGREHESVPSCAVCEVIADAQEKAYDKGYCGAVNIDHAPMLVCDREPGHPGEHRDWVEQHDAVLFWRSK
jgi:hypothetical protein